MRIKRIVLENHRYIAILRSNVVNKLVTDVDFTVGNFLKTCYHSQGSGLTAT